MPQLSDDLRFQKLPPEEVRNQIKKSMDKKDWKYILIDHTSWYNQRTRCKHDIYNMPIFADCNTSARPKAIKQIYVEEKQDGQWTVTNKYTYNMDYVHVNIASSTSSEAGSVYIPDADDENKRYYISYCRICNPITMSHFYFNDLENLKNIFTGQLMGQNSNSPFRSVYSVAGTYHDQQLQTSGGSFIKRSAPIIQLLSRADMYTLQRKDKIAEILRNTTFPKDEELAIKTIDDDHYIVRSKKEVEKIKEEKRLSAYYPIITADMCKDLIENIPRTDIDFGCFGLGSAGTGVLDLLSRSTFFTEYLFVDFDKVEPKNLRNQWYNKGNIGTSKVDASYNIFTNRRDYINIVNIVKYNRRYQTVPLDYFDFKYVFTAFDSIDARIGLLDTLAEKKTKVEYLIDARYDDLTASVFVIDMKDKEQLEYYKKGLEADAKAFEEEEKQYRINNEEDFIKYLTIKQTFKNCCGSVKSDLVRLLTGYYPTSSQINAEILCANNVDNQTCGSEACHEHFKDFYRKNEKILKQCIHFPKEESSCVRQNFVDIYHFASTFIFDAIREIESGKEKPFTHIDVTTEPLPKFLILRK